MTREGAIDVLKHNYPSACFTDLCEAVEIAIQALSAQPEIIYCKDCKKHFIGFDRKFGEVTWKEGVCPLVFWRGQAQGHEFDYQYCAMAERRQDE